MADRYVFSIHSNTKWGVDVGVSFFTTYCPNDATAIELLEIVNTYLPNYAKCSLSKVLREAQGFEIPDSGAELTDISVVSFAMAASSNPAIRRTIKIPLPYVQEGDSQVTPGIGEVGAALMDAVCAEDGTPLDEIYGYSTAPKNIVSGGPVSYVSNFRKFQQERGAKK